LKIVCFDRVVNTLTSGYSLFVERVKVTLPRCETSIKMLKRRLNLFEVTTEISWKQ